MTEDSAKWHWGEGLKYAKVAIKTLFLLNGAAAISVLTFIGNVKDHASQFAPAIELFGLGALTSIPTFVFAYLTQLYYGNAEVHEIGSPPFKSAWALGTRWHISTYIFLLAGILEFGCGLLCAVAAI